MSLKMNEKPVNTLILDTGPVIKNEPSVSTLLAKSERLVTTPAVISEIKDAVTRSRVETTLVPFLEIKQPNAVAVKFVQDFARRTGDLAVLSRADIEILALAYELECEKNGGDWRLRNAPGQKRMNGPPPRSASEETNLNEPEVQQTSQSKVASPLNVDIERSGVAPRAPWATHVGREASADNLVVQTEQPVNARTETGSDDVPQSKENVSKSVSESMADLMLTGSEKHQDKTSPDQAAETADEPIKQAAADNAQQEDGITPESASESESDSDSEGWITPSNIKRHQLEAAGAKEQSTPETRVMQVATLTTDFAMQNVLLQINLNLLSPSLQRVKHLKTFVLRCHACFQTCKDMTKQFCPRCGQSALNRVTCSTNANGEFKLHLKKNMQWNTRGDRYSIPKPTAGAANGRVKGGGKGGWGSGLILTEDQKEYTRAVDQERREKKIADLMDADYMPAMFSGSGKRDGRPGGRPRVGAGRTVNSRKR